MKRPKKMAKKPRAQKVRVAVCGTKNSIFWQPIPFDKNGRFIPSTVDCLFNQDYYRWEEAAGMVRSL